MNQRKIDFDGHSLITPTAIANELELPKSDRFDEQLIVGKGKSPCCSNSPASNSRKTITRPRLSIGLRFRFMKPAIRCIRAFGRNWCRSSRTTRLPRIFRKIR